MHFFCTFVGIAVNPVDSIGPPGHRGHGVPLPIPPLGVTSLPVRVWTQHHTPEGKPYYYNNLTRQSVWEKPMDFDKSVAMPEKLPLAG